MLTCSGHWFWFSERHNTLINLVLIYIPRPPCSHAAENRSSACRRPCSKDATNTKSFAESKRLILHFPAMTPTSTRLFIHIMYSTFSKRSVHSTHSCRNPTPTVKGCVLPSLTWAQTNAQECSELFQIIFWAAAAIGGRLKPEI